VFDFITDSDIPPMQDGSAHLPEPNHSADTRLMLALSEAMELASQFKAKQRALNDRFSTSNVTKRRNTLSLDLEKDIKLERLAAAGGI
jgi:hypothetical protein